MPPKIWPLFKVHKLSQLQIEQKVTPPQRFINAAKHGPLYRLGQWSSPHLTKISRAYCGEEFILDTPHLLRQIEDFNREPSSGNLLLATLDVEALYPSINPQLALSAITEAFAEDSTTSDWIKTALREFIELGFEESFVAFRGSCYKPLIGIPTGGCDSFVKLFRRFIDDCFLIWKGTKRQFSLFVTNLNAFAENFGIRFGSWEIGKSVNFLDLTLYLPRLTRYLPRQTRDFHDLSRDIAANFYDFCRDNAAIFGILACRGTAIFGLQNRNKFLPLPATCCSNRKLPFNNVHQTLENGLNNQSKTKFYCSVK